MAKLRKATAGSTSLGYTWDEPGQVVEVADEHLAELLAIQDAGFSVVEDALEDPADADGGSGDAGDELTEVTPDVAPVAEPATVEGGAITEPAPVEPATEAPEPARKPARKAIPRKAAAKS